MLTEHLIAAIAAPTKPNAGGAHDAAIVLHEWQPLTAPRQIFKKSASARHGIAVSSSHVFAAQEGKAVIHVYSRDTGRQELLVPFPERIHSIALAADDTVLLLGTESGRVLAWEICSGRLVSTATSHLQPVTCLAVDPSSRIFLSASPDAIVHVWALPAILSFDPATPRSPMHTLSAHRAPIAAIACGHSATVANIAISVSEDRSAVVWDYHNGQTLRTYLLPEAPTAVAIDPADRAFHVAYSDGSLQTVDFYDDLQRKTAVDVLRSGDSSHRPIQPSPTTRFDAASQKLGAAQSLSLSWDGTTLVSGHSSGKVVAWDIARSNYLSTLIDLSGPVSTVQFLPPTGFPQSHEPTFKIHTLVKPKQDAVLTTGNALVPPSYTLSMQFTGHLCNSPVPSTENRSTPNTTFEEAFSHPSFPSSMLEESLAELESWGASSGEGATLSADFVSLDQDPTAGTAEAAPDAQQKELKELKTQLAALQRIQKVTFSQLAELREEKEYFIAQEKKRAARAKTRAQKQLGRANGSAFPNPTSTNGDVEMNDGSSDTTPNQSASDDDDDNDDATSDES